jgi:hypothetical protein
LEEGEVEIEISISKKGSYLKIAKIFDTSVTAVKEGEWRH